MPRWEINLNSNVISSSLKEVRLQEPFGFTLDTTEMHIEVPRKKQLIENKLFEVATSSKMQIFMTGFMFWMIGNSISIFALFAIVQAMMSSVGGLLKFNQVFEPYEGMVNSLLKYKLIYIGIQLISIGIVVYKLSSMGLLPVSPVDYVDLVPPYSPKEILVQL